MSLELFYTVQTMKSNYVTLNISITGIILSC